MRTTITTFSQCHQICGYPRAASPRPCPHHRLLHADPGNFHSRLRYRSATTFPQRRTLPISRKLHEAVPCATSAPSTRSRSPLAHGLLQPREYYTAPLHLISVTTARLHEFSPRSQHAYTRKLKSRYTKRLMLNRSCRYYTGRYGIRRKRYRR